MQNQQPNPQGYNTNNPNLPNSSINWLQQNQVYYPNPQMIPQAANFHQIPNQNFHMNNDANNIYMMQQYQMQQQYQYANQYNQAYIASKKQNSRKDFVVPSRKDRYNEYSDDMIEEVVNEYSSSTEAEFTDEDYEDEVDLEHEEEPVKKRSMVLRQRKNVKKKTSDDDDDDELRDDAEQGHEEAKIEHIYTSRVKDGQLEYLIRFKNSKDSICQWVEESLLVMLENSQYHLNKLKHQTTSMLNEQPSDLYPIAFRKEGNKYQLLYRFVLDQNALMYWDYCTDEQFQKFQESRRKIEITDPDFPTGDIPEPQANIINAKSDSVLRPYQLLGLKWLINCWKDRHGSVLADEMGLGKTIQVLSFLTYLNRYTDWHGPFLITVRTNTFKQWCEEIEKWTDLAYIPYNASPQYRKMIIEHQFPFLDDEGKPVPNTYSFNVLLISYDVFLKDVELLQDINWHVLVVDEGHRIKNSEGKKNNMMRNSIKAKHRIILTGTPVQNTIQELWTLLNFVSQDHFEEEPDFLSGKQDIESLAPEKIEELREMIKPHLLRRTKEEAESSIAPKSESVTFVSLSPIQRELIRLIKLHKLWRLRGVQIDESNIDYSHESASIQKVCCHPFLIEGAESYYINNNPGKSELELLRDASSKFVWLEKVLDRLKKEGHKVLIFSQKVKLLKILRRFCVLKGHENEILTGEMSDGDKNDAISSFSKSATSFVFLISTRAGNEGLNLTVADTAIIFDPDWNPQNDLQAQARVHRIGQTQKVDIIRLITYQTYEHEMFIRAQKKLGLWTSLLGIEEQVVESGETGNLKPPPQISFDMPIDQNSDLLPQISTVVTDFSSGALPRLEMPLLEEVDYADGVSDEVFLEKFPVEVEDVITKRPKRSRSLDDFITRDTANNIYEMIKAIGYPTTENVTANVGSHSPLQVIRFSRLLLILSFRALVPQDLIFFPFLIHCLERDVYNFDISMLVCLRKTKWMSALPEDHELNREIDSCKSLKNRIKSSSFKFLSIVEMKLIAQSWATIFKKEEFKFGELPPPQTQFDVTIFNSLFDTKTVSFDPLNERVSVVVNRMRSDLIISQQLQFTKKVDFWTENEFAAVRNVLYNFPYGQESAVELHARTAITSKTTRQVFDFVTRFVNEVKDSKKFPLQLKYEITFFDRAPHDLVSQRGSYSWANVTKKEAFEMRDAMLLLARLRDRYRSIPPQVPTKFWGLYQTRLFYECILKYGLSMMQYILLDKKIGLVYFLNDSDKKYIAKKSKSIIPSEDSAPTYCIELRDLYHHICSGGIDRQSNSEQFDLSTLPSEEGLDEILEIEQTKSTYDDDALNDNFIDNDIDYDMETDNYKSRRKYKGRNRRESEVDNFTSESES